MRERSAAGKQRRVPLTRRRLAGLDRSGPAPPQTRPGQPLRPFTLPNLVGYSRLAALPAFLYVALESGDGRTAASSLLFAAIAGSDYLDGLLARATGQYSRLGAMLDPVVDRLTVLAGVVVCWRFELLPRGLLAVLVARELLILVLGQLWLRRGGNLRVNWPGRLAVWPVMTAIFMGLVALFEVAEISLYIGLALSLLSFAMYARVGFASRRQ